MIIFRSAGKATIIVSVSSCYSCFFITLGRSARSVGGIDIQIQTALKYLDLAAELDSTYQCLPKIFCSMTAKPTEERITHLEKMVRNFGKHM